MSFEYISVKNEFALGLFRLHSYCNVLNCRTSNFIPSHGSCFSAVVALARRQSWARSSGSILRQGCKKQTKNLARRFHDTLNLQKVPRIK